MTPQDDAQQINWDYGHRNQMEAHIEALEAEVAQLRQDRDELAGKLRAWAEAEDKIIEALGPRDRDILQRIQQLVAGEAARDHLRARLLAVLTEQHEETKEDKDLSRMDRQKVLEQPPLPPYLEQMKADGAKKVKEAQLDAAFAAHSDRAVVAPCPLLTDDEPTANPYIASCGTQFERYDEMAAHEQKHARPVLSK